MPRIKITQEKSRIRCLKKHRRTLEALGLRRINHFVVHDDTPQIRGMVDQIRYLVRVESVAGVQTAAPAKSRRAKT
jgi:large subunit ribosomal protein L30